MNCCSSRLFRRPRWSALPGVLGVALFAMSFILAMPALAGPHVLTVIGDVGNSNRPAFDGFRDAFLKFQDKTFESAFAFDRDGLLALPQTTVTASAEGWPSPVTATGPKLADVMAAAGVAPETDLTFLAFDGYEVTLDAAERSAQEWIMALDADGEPLSIGGRGPVWLLHDTGGQTVSADVEAKWIWSVFLVAAGE